MQSLSHKQQLKLLASLLLSLVFIGMFLLSRYDYLTYHTTVELFSVIVSVCIFIIVWNSRDFIEINPFLLIAYAFLVIGILDMLHLLTFPGTGLLPGLTANTSVQFWVAARYIEGISFLLAAYSFKYSLEIEEIKILFSYFSVGLVLILLIFYNNFPICFVAGRGLTQFKILSEFIISGIFLLSVYIFQSIKTTALPKRELIIALIFGVLSELSFTLYSDNIADQYNFLGHIFKLVTVYYIYKAFIEKVLKYEFNYIIREAADSQEQLVATGSMLSTFFHDLKNPLSLIKALSQLGELKSRQSPENEYFQRICRQVDHLTGMLNSSLVASKPREMMLTDCAPPLAEVIRNIKPVCEVNKIEIRYSNMSIKRTWLEIDLFKRAVTNLLQNSVNVLKYNGLIEVNAVDEDNEIVIYIKDNGPGLPKVVQKNIFKPFKESSTGSGLGLYMSWYSITKIHNGQISFQTGSEGTTFFIRLPAATSVYR